MATALVKRRTNGIESFILKQDLVEVLKPLFRIYSPSYEEADMSDYVFDFLTDCGFEVQKDSMGNIMAHRGELKDIPLLNAHLDTCQKESDKEHLHKVDYNEAKDCFQLEGVQIGCDDKAGIGIILCLAKFTDLSFKVLLTVQEEEGRKGVQHIPGYFFQNVCWAFSLDNAGSTEIIIQCLDKKSCRSQQFVELLKKIGRSQGVPFEVHKGTIADIYHIANHSPSVNISVGYYNWHRENDYLIVEETYKICLVIKECLEIKYEFMSTLKDKIYEVSVE